MKKIILLLTILLLAGFGCSVLQKNNVDLVNTFRDAKLLFQINYPQNWVITDYVDYQRNGGCVLYKMKGSISEKYGEDFYESCGEGTELAIANHPTPYPGWSLDYQPPEDYMSVAMRVRPKEGIYQDYYKDENTAVQKEKINIDISGNSKLNIIVYDYKDGLLDGEKDLGLPTAVAYYYGDNYLYEFDIPGWGPRSEEEIRFFKQIVGSFKEIK